MIEIILEQLREKLVGYPNISEVGIISQPGEKIFNVKSWSASHRKHFRVGVVVPNSLIEDIHVNVILHLLLRQIKCVEEVGPPKENDR